MEIDISTHKTVSIVRVTGFLDTRASPAFERKMADLLQGGARLFAIDFTNLDMITSAGIRVLMMVVKRLRTTEGVVLWGLNAQVKMVFSIAGLAEVFQVVDTEQAAVDRLEQPLATDKAASGQLSKLARLVIRLLGQVEQQPVRRPSGEAVSQLTNHVLDILTTPNS
jgi:stage II sporulation protein AA (anti-sigma F factor antagonist)